MGASPIETMQVMWKDRVGLALAVSVSVKANWLKVKAAHSLSVQVSSIVVGEMTDRTELSVDCSHCN